MADVTEIERIEHDPSARFHIGVHIGPNTHFVDDGHMYLIAECLDENCERDDHVRLIAESDFTDNHGWWCYSRRPDPDEVTP